MSRTAPTQSHRAARPKRVRRGNEPSEPVVSPDLAADPPRNEENVRIAAPHSRPLTRLQPAPISAPKVASKRCTPRRTETQAVETDLRRKSVKRNLLPELEEAHEEDNKLRAMGYPIGSADFMYVPACLRARGLFPPLPMIGYSVGPDLLDAAFAPPLAASAPLAANESDLHSEGTEPGNVTSVEHSEDMQLIVAAPPELPLAVTLSAEQRSPRTMRKSQFRYCMWSEVRRGPPASPVKETFADVPDMMSCLVGNEVDDK